MNFVKHEKNENYALVSLDRPDALNALNLELLTELEEVLKELEKDKNIYAVLITGSSDRAFAAGADVAAMQKMDVAGRIEFCRQGRCILNRISSMDFIKIAGIQGFALGGGLELALACDLRIASTSAQMGLPEVSLGILPGFGGTQRLPRLVGQGLALEIILSGRRIDAAYALQIGLINHVYDDSGFLDAAREYLVKLLGKNSIRAQLLARQAVIEGASLDLVAALQKEDELLSTLFQAPDAQEGFTAFVEKRKAKFESR